MLLQEVDLKVMQEILGHSQMAMTMDLHSYPMPSAKRDVAVCMGGTLLTAAEC